MKKYGKNKKDFDKYIVVLFGIIAFFFVLAATSKYGAGLSPDAVAYLYAAESFKAGRGFLYFGYKTPMIQWPPLFPAVLAIFSTTGIKTEIAARMLNASMFALIVILSGYWFKRHIRFKPLAAIGTASVLLSLPLLYVSGYIWSETLFILLEIAFLISIERFGTEGKKSAYRLSAIFAGLACLTRYVGIIAIITGLAVMLLKYEREKFYVKLKSAFVFGIVSGLPLMLWATRNYIYSRTLFGNRAPSAYSLSQAARLGFETVLQWFLPIRQLDARFGADLVFYAGILLAVILAGMITTVVLIAWLNLVRKWKKVNLVAWSRQNAASIIPAALFFIFYTAYMIYTASVVAFDRINDRLMAPVFVPLMFIIFYILDNIPLLLYKYFWSRTLTYTLIAIAGLWLLYPLYRVYQHLDYSMTMGIGMASEIQWRQSELMAELRKYAGSSKVYSNFAERTFAHAGFFSEYVPRKGSLPEYGLEPFKEAIRKNEGAYVAWFKKPGMLKSLYTPEELNEYFRLEPVLQASDGTLYKIFTK